MSAITTHVLDTAEGRPAAGIRVRLDVAAEPSPCASDGWRPLADGVTDADGRVRELGPDEITAGRYRLTFDTGGYFAEQDRATFLPEVTVTFTVIDPRQHHHIPLLLSPFAFSTYRGS